MRKSEHIKSNSTAFLRSMIREEVYNPKNNIRPFQGEGIPQFSSRSGTWNSSNTILPNLNTHSRTAPPVAYKEETRTQQSNALGPSASFTDTLIRRNRQRSIPPRFEHRLQPSIDKTNQPTEPAWRSGPDRTRSSSLTPTLYDTQHRKRVVGLRTADLSNRLRYPKRENLMNRHSSPRSVQFGRRNPGKVHVKDRLSLPAQGPERIVRRQDCFIDDVTPRSDAHRSHTQNDPRRRPGDEKTPSECEKDSNNSEAFYQSPSNSPVKPPSKLDQFFDEETQLKEADTMDVQNNFDVPLPPSLPPENSPVIQIHDEVEKAQLNNSQSFWDESDELHINTRKNAEQTSSFSPVRIAPAIPSKENALNFFDDEIPTTHEYTAKPTHIHRPHHSKPNREHSRTDKHNLDKLKRHKRKVSPTPVKLHHIKRLPKKVKCPPAHPLHRSPSKLRQKGDKNSPRSLVSHPNAAILKLNTKSHTHIRVKKTVNLADKESDHSSSDECAELPESRKLVIPLPNSPLQPLELITGEERVATPVHTQTNSLCSKHSRQLGSASGKETRKSVDASGPILNRKRRNLDEFLALRNQSISESSDIGLHIEFVEDLPANATPEKSAQARLSAGRTPPSNSTGMGLLNIPSYKPISPKSDLETPDSVFTPGFDSSQQTCPTFPLNSHSPLVHSPEYHAPTHDPNCKNATLHCESDTHKYVSKHRSVKNMKLRSSKQKTKQTADSSPCEPSIANNTRQVCIPLTKLDVTQYVKSNSQPPDTNNSSKEKPVITVVSQCMFCHRAANEKNLGYLYGPYFRTGDNLKITPQPISSRKKASKEHDENELWVHAPCALWSPGVLLVSFHLRGLVEAFEGSQAMECSECGSNGATLHCDREGCPSVYHYTCAENNNCRFNHDCFKLQCPEHDSNL